MLSRYSEKNKFGGYTWVIKIDPIFSIEVNATHDNKYVVEIKEYKWLRKKTQHSFVSEDTMEGAVTEAFEKFYDFVQSHRHFSYTPQQLGNKLSEVLGMIRRENIPSSY